MNALRPTPRVDVDLAFEYTLLVTGLLVFAKAVLLSSITEEAEQAREMQGKVLGGATHVKTSCLSFEYRRGRVGRHDDRDVPQR